MMDHPYGDAADGLARERERQADAMVWPRLGKRFRECTPREIQQVIDAVYAEAAKDRRRTTMALARIDQAEARIADTIRQAELWANGGES